MNHKTVRKSGAGWRCNVDSGAFVGELSTFITNLNASVVAASDLVNSEIYKNRLKRCLSQPGNKAAFVDFLVMDNILLGVLTIAEKHAAQKVRELREEVVDAAVKHVKREIKRRPDASETFDKELELYLKSRTAPMDDRARKALSKGFPTRF